MDEIMMTMIKEEAFDDSLTDNTAPYGGAGDEDFYYKDAMALDAVMRLERLLD